MNLLLSEQEIMPAFASVIIVYTRKWEADEANVNLMQDILRLLHVCSQYNDPCVVAHLVHNVNGNAMLCLGNLTLLHPLRVVQIVSYLYVHCQVRSDFPTSTIWRKILTKVSNGNDDSLKRELLNCLLEFSQNKSAMLEMSNTEVTRMVDMLKELPLESNTSVSINEFFSLTLTTLYLHTLSYLPTNFMHVRKTW